MEEFRLRTHWFLQWQQEPQSLNSPRCPELDALATATESNPLSRYSIYTLGLRNTSEDSDLYRPYSSQS